MAANFPLNFTQFMDRLRPSAVTWDLADAVEVAETAGGEVLTADVGTRLWTGRIDMGLLTRDEAADLLPFFGLLRGAGTSFLVTDPRRPAPRLDPSGATLGAAVPVLASIAANMRDITLSGLPAGYLLRRGDLLSFTYGTSPVRHALHELIGNANADAGGVTPVFDVNPPLRPGATVGTAVTLLRAYCKARLVPGSVDGGTTRQTMTEGASFRWIQTLR